MKNQRSYTDENIIKYSKEVKSMAGLLVKLGLKPVGGNYANMKVHLQRLGLECDHWTGQGWNSGQRLKDWSNYVAVKSMRKHILNDRGRVCEKCTLDSWLGQPIALEVHHIDGDRTNNDLKNLIVVCGNCHNHFHKYKYN